MAGIVGALFLIGVGLGVLAVAHQGWRSGELPAGARGFSGTYRPRRDEEPGAFHFFFALYVAMGAAALVYGGLMLVGAVPPLPLR